MQIRRINNTTFRSFHLNEGEKNLKTARKYLQNAPLKDAFIKNGIKLGREESLDIIEGIGNLEHSEPYVEHLFETFFKKIADGVGTTFNALRSAY